MNTHLTPQKIYSNNNPHFYHPGHLLAPQEELGDVTDTLSCCGRLGDSLGCKLRKT